MSQHDNLGSFIKDTKPLLTDYVETKLSIFRLQALRIISKSAGYLLWLIISLFLFFIVVIFLGIVLGFWFSALLHSYPLGFALATGLIMLVFVVLAIFRKALFIHPLMHSIIRKALEDFKENAVDPDDKK